MPSARCWHTSKPLDRHVHVQSLVREFGDGTPRCLCLPCDASGEQLRRDDVYAGRRLDLRRYARIMSFWCQAFARPMTYPDARLRCCRQIDDLLRFVRTKIRRRIASERIHLTARETASSPRYRSGDSMIRAQPSHEFESVHGGHRDIAADQIRRLVADQREGFSSVRGHQDLVSPLPEHDGEQFACGRVIVDDENVCHIVYVG